MFKKYKHKFFAVILAVVLVFVDYITKVLATNYMPKDKTISVIPYLINFRFLYNDGAAFGILDDKRWVFMLATVVFDLTVAIVLGICVSMFLFVINNSSLHVETSAIEPHRLDKEINYNHSTTRVIIEAKTP